MTNASNVKTRGDQGTKTAKPEWLTRIRSGTESESTIRMPADNFPSDLARVCDSVGKSPAWRGRHGGLDAAFPSHFVMACEPHRVETRTRSPGGVGLRGGEDIFRLLSAIFFRYNLVTIFLRAKWSRRCYLGPGIV